MRQVPYPLCEITRFVPGQWLTVYLERLRPIPHHLVLTCSFDGLRTQVFS